MVQPLSAGEPVIGREPPRTARARVGQLASGVAFDVFLSYSRADQALVERVAQGLHARGLRVFLDRWYLAPGRSWPEAREKVLARCRAVAVLLGHHGLGEWQKLEQYKALDPQAK